MSIQELDKGVQEYMLKTLNCYEELRGKTFDSHQSPFWDAVVISASDIDQRKGYEKQISQKQQRGELPLSIAFRVFSDPPEYKIGSGGSMLFILDELLNIYESKMYDMRILLIPAGGYSQRLPNLCVLGKLFCPLPFGEKNYQMLDLILALYLPFLKRMPPGVFISSSDAVISFSIADDDNTWTFTNGGFTALAHPSPVKVGTSHGVYVLPKRENLGSDSTYISECVQVLQKPTVLDMIEKKAIVKGLSLNGLDEDFIFSDSTFFFDHNISKKLINIYRNSKPIKCELNAYGDFLKMTGSSSCPSVHAIREGLISPVQIDLHSKLLGTNLSILVLKHSNFHHLGTMEEYAHSLTGRNKFCSVFPYKNFSFSVLSIGQISPHHITGTIMHSVIHPSSIVPESTVLEYCDINIPITVGSNCLISSVKLSDCSVAALDCSVAALSIPDGSLFHTVTLCNRWYVTIACSVHDNVKETMNENASNIYFFRKKLKYFVEPDCIKHLFNADCDVFSLWNCKLFPLCSSPEVSFRETLTIVSRITQIGDSYCDIQVRRNDYKWIAMSDILSLKDTRKTLIHQDELYSKIARLKLECAHAS